MNIEDWSTLGLIGLISLLSKVLSRVLQHHSLKVSILQCSAFMAQLSQPNMVTGKTIALSMQTFGSKMISLILIKQKAVPKQPDYARALTDLWKGEENSDWRSAYCMLLTRLQMITSMVLFNSHKSLLYYFPHVPRRDAQILRNSFRQLRSYNPWLCRRASIWNLICLKPKSRLFPPNNQERLH